MATFNYRVWAALKLLNEQIARDYFFGDMSEEDAIQWMEANKGGKLHGQTTQESGDN